VGSNIWSSSSITKTRIINIKIKSETNGIVENDASANGRRTIKIKTATVAAVHVDEARRRRVRLCLLLLLLLVAVVGWRQPCLGLGRTRIGMWVLLLCLRMGLFGRSRGSGSGKRRGRGGAERTGRKTKTASVTIKNGVKLANSNSASWITCGSG
jgi:hypothetical protein